MTRLFATLFLFFFQGIHCGLRLENQRSDGGYIDTTRGKGIRLTCEPTEPLTDDQRLEWVTSTGETIGSSSPSRFAISLRAGKRALVFTSIQPHDEGTYYCKLFEQGVNSDELAVSIRVNKGVEWSSNQTIYGARLGDPLTIDCSVKDPSIMVEANDRLGLPLETSPLFSFQRINNEYTAPQLTDAYQNEWIRCLAFVHLPNKADVQETREIQLQVYKEPKFNQSLPATFYAIEGQSTALKCHVVESVPRVVKFEFLRNGEILATNGHFVVNSFLGGQDFAELLIANVTEEDFGYYVCRVHNGELQSETEIRLMEAAPPKEPKVSFLGNLNGTTTWKILNEDENQDLDVLSYSVRYGIKRESRQSDEEQLPQDNKEAREWFRLNELTNGKVILRKNRNNTYIIRGLHNGKVYGFAFSARNAAGEGDSLYIDVDLNDQIEVSGAFRTMVNLTELMFFAFLYVSISFCA